MIVLPIVQDISVALALLVGLVLALEAGFRAGRRAAAKHESQASGQVGAIEGAVLGLLGLLLAFSFSAAGSRFFERQDLITQEANAIGTAYLRADLLDEPHASELRAALKEYTEHRLRLSRTLRSGISPADAAEIERLHNRMWSAAAAGANAKPAVAVVVLPPVNEVIDLHSTRMAAGLKHVPSLVLGLLIACSFLGAGAIGYGCGQGRHRSGPLTVPLAILIGISLWITIDLDRPRAGLLQLSDAPLAELKFSKEPK